MLNVFISYSHRDEAVRGELEVHLAMLQRQGVIEAWHDRRILAGDEFDAVISENLEKADIILLLVSPYFLASRYCYEIEVRRALERHAAREARVIPVVVDPCDWQATPFAKLATLPKDAKPIAKYPNQHDAFLEIVQAIRAVANQRPKSPAVAAARSAPPAPSAAGRVAPDIRSSNLRVKKEFTEHDLDTFLEESFEYIAKYFEGSLAELQGRNPDIQGKFRRITANHFSATVYRHGKSVSTCGIRTSDQFGSRMVVLSSEPTSTNSMSDAVGVDHDGQLMFLRPSLGFGGYQSRDSQENRLTQQGAAEYFWSRLMGPLQR